jgi:hypothetical protein
MSDVISHSMGRSVRLSYRHRGPEGKVILLFAEDF